MLSFGDRFDQLFGHTFNAHPRLQIVGGHFRRWYHAAMLAFELFLLTTVKEEGDLVEKRKFSDFWLSKESLSE